MWFYYTKRVDIFLSTLYGAADRSRTGTVLPPRDFKSLASAYSATAAAGTELIIAHSKHKINCFSSFAAVFPEFQYHISDNTLLFPLLYTPRFYGCSAAS